MSSPITITLERMGCEDTKVTRTATMSVFEGSSAQALTLVGSTTDAKKSFTLLSASPPLIRIQLVVDQPSWGPQPGSPLLTVIQDLVLTAPSAQNPAGLVPANVKPFGARLHPRLDQKKHTTKGNEGVVPHFMFDVRFVDITTIVRANDTGRLFRNQANKGPTNQKILRQIEAGGASYDLDDFSPTRLQQRPAGSQFFLYEYTSGSPKVWTLCCGDLDNADLFHPVLFVRPPDDAYTDGNDVNLWRVARFLHSPTPDAPFWIRAGAPPTNGLAANFPTTAPRCGFEKQVVQSKQPVVFVTPVAPPSSLNDWTATKALAARLLSLRKALFGDRHVGVNKQELRRNGRVAVGGFSLGGAHAFMMFNNNVEHLDEFYWFDPPGVVPSNADASFTPWLKGNAERRLRMIGALQHADMLEIESKLRANLGLAGNAASSPPPRVTTLPVAGYWQGSDVYKAAVAIPQNNGALLQGFPEKFDSIAAATATTQLSRDSGVLANPAARTDDKGRPEAGTDFRSASSPGSRPTKPPLPISCTVEEAAGLLRFLYMNERKQPAPGQTVKGLETTLAALEADATGSRGIRHQWAVVGGDGTAVGPGQGDPTRGANFVGHLEYCLRNGRFPS